MITDGPLPGLTGSALHGPQALPQFTATPQRWLA
jgi:hypothetical protein